MLEMVCETLYCAILKFPDPEIKKKKKNSDPGRISVSILVPTVDLPDTVGL